MKLFVIFAAFICLANANPAVTEETLEVKALRALKAVADEGDLFAVTTEAEFNQKTSTEQTTIAENFANKFQLNDQDDQDDLRDEIKDHPDLIEKLIAAKEKEAADLKTEMDQDDNLDKAVKLIAKSPRSKTNTASAIGMSGLLVFSLVLLH